MVTRHPAFDIISLNFEISKLIIQLLLLLGLSITPCKTCEKHSLGSDFGRILLSISPSQKVFNKSFVLSKIIIIGLFGWWGVTTSPEMNYRCLYRLSPGNWHEEKMNDRNWHVIKLYMTPSKPMQKNPFWINQREVFAPVSLVSFLQLLRIGRRKQSNDWSGPFSFSPKKNWIKKWTIVIKSDNKEKDMKCQTLTFVLKLLIIPCCPMIKSPIIF